MTLEFYSELLGQNPPFTLREPRANDPEFEKTEDLPVMLTLSKHAEPFLSEFLEHPALLQAPRQTHIDELLRLCRRRFRIRSR